MAEQIDELLVGLGIDTDERSFQQAQSHFNGLRSAALQFAGAIGAGFGINELTFGFASANDQLGKFSDVMNVAPRLVDNLGYALERSGGEASDAMRSIQTMASIFDDFYRGETGRIDAAAQFGLDPRVILEAENMADAYERLADATGSMGPDQRRRVLEALGMGSVAEITLFEGGSAALRAYFDEAQRLAPMTRELTDTAAEFNDELSRLRRTAKGLSDEISADLLPGLIEFSTWLRTFINENSDILSEFIKDGPEAIGARYGEEAREWASKQISERAPWLADLMGRADDATDTQAQEALEITKRWIDREKQATAPNVSRETMPTVGGSGGRWRSLSEGQPDEGAWSWVADIHPETLDAIQRLVEETRRPGASGDLLPDEMNYEPSASELIPEGSRLELNRGNRALMREYFPEQYQGSRDTTYNINVNGAGDPRAVALEVERVLRRSAETSAQDFSSAIT